MRDTPELKDARIIAETRRTIPPASNPAQSFVHNMIPCERGKIYCLNAAAIVILRPPGRTLSENPLIWPGLARNKRAACKRNLSGSDG